MRTSCDVTDIFWQHATACRCCRRFYHLENIMERTEAKFILYACAGCSKGGQAAYQTAIQLDTLKVAEMSCLAGIASGKSSFYKKIRNRKIVAIDGCPIECAKTVLQNQGLKIAEHFQLKEYGIRKNETATQRQIETVVEQITQKLI